MRPLALLLALSLPVAALAADEKAPPPSGGGLNLDNLNLDTGAKPDAKKDAKASNKPERKPLPIDKMLFDRQGIQDVVQYHMPDIQECYEQRLADTGAKIEGRVFVQFVVDGHGNVTQARAVPKKSTVKDDRAVDCVLDTVRHMQFPKPEKNRDHPIEYPFDFKVIK